LELMAAKASSARFDFSADGMTIKRGDLAEKYEGLAAKWRQVYYKKLGIPEAGVKAGGATADWDVLADGADYIFHGRRTR